MGAGRCYTGQIPHTMKSLRTMAACAAALCGSLSLAALPGEPDYIPVQIHQTEEATFPRSLVIDGIKSGAATVAISIDDNGQLADYLVTGYTKPAFGDQAVAAIKKWKFEPARIHGAPRNSKADLTFRFELEGVVVVTMSVVSNNELIHNKITPGADSYTACTLSQLDRIPNPTKIVNPVYPTQLARSSRGGHVLVEFYIDEQGRVRMPSVNPETIEANEELAAVAVTAVSQWHFDPPLSRGRAVLVLAQQDFSFKPGAP
jgi:TonB family protein